MSGLAGGAGGAKAPRSQHLAAENMRSLAKYAAAEASAGPGYGGLMGMSGPGAILLQK